MIEGCVQPRHRVVAQRAVLREICGDVVRHSRYGRGALVVRGMAAVARGRRIRVIAADVALRALQVRVSVCEREERVIKARRVPTGRGVASRAIRRGKRGAGLRMDWIRRRVVIGHVA